MRKVNATQCKANLTYVKYILLAAVVGLTGCSQFKQQQAVTEAPKPVVTVAPVTEKQVSRVSTAVPFPRGLHLMDGKLYVLARGRVRESGGVDAAIDDRAGTIFAIDPNVSEPIATTEVSPAVRDNGVVFAAPTEPPFKLFNRNAKTPTADRETDRPYCSLRYDPLTKNFFVCAFSGIDKPEGKGSTFSKNTNDGIHRFDTRTKTWHIVEKHNVEAGGNYPHHDPYSRPAPHGWLNGPDNCLAVGNWLYGVAKDNSMMARYDLREIAAKPDAPAPPSEWVLGEEIRLSNLIEETPKKAENKFKSFFKKNAKAPAAQSIRLLGHSMLAARDGWLYIGYRTSSVIVRVPLEADGSLKQPIVGELVARFDPYDPATRKSANLTDMVFGPEGDLYVISAQPSKVFRFRPDPTNIFDGRSGQSAAWANLAELTQNPKMKSENVLVDERGRVFVTSGDAYAYQAGNGGTVYRIDPAK